MLLSGEYISGFVDGEGCFSITIGKHHTTKNRLDPRLNFEIELRGDDREILEMIAETIGCGRIYELNYDRYGWHPHVKLKISGIKDIIERIIPFFQKHPLYGKKKFSFEIFCQAARIFEAKQHLTEMGINELIRLKEKMNKYSSRSSIRQGAGNPRARREGSEYSDVLSYSRTLPVKSTKSVVPEVGTHNRKDWAS